MGAEERPGSTTPATTSNASRRAGTRLEPRPVRLRPCVVGFSTSTLWQPCRLFCTSRRRRHGSVPVIPWPVFTGRSGRLGLCLPAHASSASAASAGNYTRRMRRSTNCLRRWSRSSSDSLLQDFARIASQLQFQARQPFASSSEGGLEWRNRPPLCPRFEERPGPSAALRGSPSLFLRCSQSCVWRGY